MRSVLEYNNFRKYILDFYKEKKRTTSFSWRDFARAAEFNSPVFLKLVCDGRSGLSLEGAERVAKVMDLSEFEYDYFIALVKFNQAKRDTERNEAFNTLQNIAKIHKVNIVGADLYTYFSNWKYAALRELAPAMPGAKPNHLAKICIPPLSTEEVNEALKFLLSSHLLSRTHGKHFYTQTNRSVATGALDFAVPAIRSFHKQMGELALKTLDTIQTTERNFSSMTLGLTEKSYQKIVREFENFRKKAIAIATSEEATERVYEFNLQLFPLSQKITKEEK